ncbi:acyltransferase [Nostoc sp. ChiVER01]|uniref:acyltransferase n=1 Tax=Nostoc sp. ChiVER01 TaxID=3075382 RepID=UPI002AD3A704|nr:acyltransferase family protein [Nostoc sp. ChiVER01]MDZ8228070.1 acyltransferase family protein [Nostoc sp. ChiVER01]
MIKEKTKNRIFYYDAIKVFAIYLVCIYHYNNINYNILNNPNLGVYINYYFYGISSIAVPLFFMVNGGLLLNKPYKLRSHLKKVLYMYILVYMWSFISLIIFIPIERASYSLKYFFNAWFFLKQGTTDHLWFLKTLISVYLLFPFIKEFYDIPERQLLKLFCFIVFVFSFGNLFLNTMLNSVKFFLGFNHFNDNSFDFFLLISPFGNYYYAFFYFIAGGILSEKVKNNKINVSNRVLLTSFFTALFVLFLYGVLMTASSNTVYDTVWNGNYSIMTLIMSVSTFLFFSKLTYENENINHCLAIIGASTLGIYLVHRFVGAVTIPYFRHLILSNSFVLNILYGFFLVLSSLLIVLLLKKLPLLRKTVDI